MSKNMSTSQRLHDLLEETINSTTPGDRLPSEPHLAKKFGVSRATLREAMRTFETQGYLSRRQGVGTFVTKPSHVIESGLEMLVSIERLAEQIGLPVSMEKIEITSCMADDKVAQSLVVEAGSELFCVSRVIHAEGRPVAYLVDMLPVTVIKPDEIDEDFTGSVLELLLERGDPPLGSSRCEIAAIAAPPEVARSLNIQRGDSLLLFEAVLYTKAGKPLDYSYSYFLPGYFKFHVVRRVG
jgi:GntR family transcriptional regulator